MLEVGHSCWRWGTRLQTQPGAAVLHLRPRDSGLGAAVLHLRPRDSGLGAAVLHCPLQVCYVLYDPTDSMAEIARAKFRMKKSVAEDVTRTMTVMQMAM